MTARVRRRGEQGAASVLAAVLIGLLMLIGCALGVASGLVVDHRRAQSAADLAALAAAGALRDGADPCSAGAEVAEANGAELASCDVRGEDVTVEVVVRGPRWLGWAGDLDSRARAGPGAGVER